MSAISSPPPDALTVGDPWEPTPVSPGLRGAVHVLVSALLVVAVLRSVLGGLPGWPWVVLCSGAVGIVYAVGVRSATVARSSRAAAVWLALLMVVWLALLLVSPDGIYLAFPWSFLLLHLLRRPVGLAAVAAVTVAAIAGFAWHQETFTVAMVIGPVIGAAVVIATVFGYQALHAESEQRRRLIVELDRTRSDLAAAERRAGVLDERERLAREIHDTLAQGLSSIQLLLQAATRSLDPARGADPSRAGELVEQARREAQENLAEARRFVRALAPGDLEQSTLAAALRRLCEATSARTGTRVVFHEEGPAVPLATAVEVALLRIAQAALGNTTQHAGATRADVTLTTMDTAVTLDVVDDGIGFDVLDPAAPTPTDDTVGGFGLRSMRSRAAEVGGVLTVESRPGRGTAVSVNVGRSAPSSTGSEHGPGDGAGDGGGDGGADGAGDDERRP
ncbi:sensor histidine kinase [Terrabacter carboxydivorans]